MHDVWQLGLGAEVQADGVKFRVWAPKRKQVDVEIVAGPQTVVPLESEAHGYFSGTVRNLKPGALYRYRLDGEKSFPDPCSRYQPEGPHGPSMVVDPQAYKWNDRGWPGVEMAGQVIYELHVGTFTPQGTFDAAAQELGALKQLGITLVELMPVAEFPGGRNWGYDGVDLYAPAHVYGDPEALKRFVDAAHAQGLAVLLDVVYNHFGPDGNFVAAYSDDYFTTRYENDWGEAIISTDRAPPRSGSFLFGMPATGLLSSMWTDFVWMPRRIFVIRVLSMFWQNCLADRDRPPLRGESY
jgi:maltooligosyltrehalose trehalohydrolase